MLRTPIALLRVLTASLGAALLLAAGSLTAPASATDPDPQLITCPGTYAGIYTPGLTSTPRPTTFTAHGTLGPCISVLGPDYASAELDTGGAGDLSCVGGGNTSGTGTITWAGGQESEFSHTGVVSLRPLGLTVLVISGTVTDGALEGSTLLWTITYVTLDVLSCLTPQGVTSLAGPTTFTLTPLT